MNLLAHGALGPYDELIYIGIAAVFGVMMLVSWFQTRMAEYDDDKHKSAPDAPPTPEKALEDEPTSPERFRLD